MSQENVELVRRMYALADQGNDSIWELIPPEFEFDFSRRLLDPVHVHGRDQARAWFEGEMEGWEGGRTRWEPKELIDADDKVLGIRLERVDVPRRSARRVDVLRRRPNGSP